MFKDIMPNIEWEFICYVLINITVRYIFSKYYVYDDINELCLQILRIESSYDNI